jgi:hypothetical protein
VDAGAPNQQLMVVVAAAVVLATISAATVGALLASRRPRHPVAGCSSASGWAWRPTS